MSSGSFNHANGSSACNSSVDCSSSSFYSISSSSSSSPMFSVLEVAAEQMMVHTDFQASFDTCNRGLNSLEPEDPRYEEFKAAFCVLGLQALAQMNQWRRVLSWVVLQYEHEEKIPAKILQMCILLHRKVNSPALVQETVRVWIDCPANRSDSGFRTVVELYLLFVLVPLGHTEEARALVTGEMGSGLFTEEQRRTALDVVEGKEREIQEAENPKRSEIAQQPVSPPGQVVHKLEAVLRFLHRKVTSVGSGSFLLRKLFLAAVLLYMLLIRMDPALPSSFMWISKLLQLLRQMWSFMFAPYYQAVTQSKAL